MKKIVFFLCFIWIINSQFSIDESFSIDRNLFLKNWESFGTTLAFKNYIRIIPDLGDRIGLLNAFKKIKYSAAFNIDIQINISKKNQSLNYGEALSLWLLRENLGYTKINYTEKNAGLFGSHNNFKGFGIFIVPNNSGRSCTIDLSITNPKKDLKLYFNEDFLFVYTKNIQTGRNELCFSLAESNYPHEQQQKRQFYFSISSSSTVDSAQNFDIINLVVSSDKINIQPNKSVTEEQTRQAKDFIRGNNSLGTDSKIYNFSKNELENKFKHILNIQNEQLLKMQHIKQSYSRTFRDMKGLIKKNSFVQHLITLEIDMRILNHKFTSYLDRLNDISKQNYTSTTNNNKEINEKIISIEDKINNINKLMDKYKEDYFNQYNKERTVFYQLEAYFNSKKQLEYHQDQLLTSLKENENKLEYALKNSTEESNIYLYISIVITGLLIFLTLIMYVKLINYEKSHLL